MRIPLHWLSGNIYPSKDLHPGIEVALQRV